MTVAARGSGLAARSSSRAVDRDIAPREASGEHERHRSHPRVEGLPPVQPSATVRDAQERAAVGQPRFAISSRTRRSRRSGTSRSRCRPGGRSASSAATAPARARCSSSSRASRSRRPGRRRCAAASPPSSSSARAFIPRSPAARTSSSTASCSGLTKKEITRRFDEIVEFAEMQDFIDAPVKTYSSGMYMRLGFAVAIHVDPDVLLVDEVLAVGDEGFTHKCLDKFAEFKRRGKTILLVTHSLGLVERFCDEALWMDGGAMKALGDPKRVVGAYVTDVESTARNSSSRRATPRRRSRRRSISPDEPASAVLPDNPIESAERPGRHVPRDRRPLGLARDRDRRRQPDRQRRRARARLSQRRAASTSA